MTKIGKKGVGPLKKKEGIIENFSYEHRAYESVDDRSLS